MQMYKTCSRCGKIHKLGQKCYANTRNYYQADPKVREFRNSAEWHRKTEEIRTRDKQLCQICLTKHIFNYKALSVHHIVPLTEDWTKRLDNDNLITLCDACHKDCESGKVTRQTQYKIIEGSINQMRSSNDTETIS